jgi:glutathione S-transferase
MRLYEYSLTRSIRCKWFLQELGVPFEAIEIDLSKGDNEKPDYLKVNPFGKVPSLVDGDLTLTESAAICEYLADKFSERGFIPTAGTAERALHDQWMYFCMSELEQPLWQIAKHTFVYEEDKCLPEAIALAVDDFKKIVAPLETLFSGRSYILGDKFQVADVMIGHTLIWAYAMRTTKGYELLAGCPSLVTYLQRMHERKALPENLRSLVAERLNGKS